ncbi:helix-turn-helix domain-containing protein [Lentzea sp. NBC_00516]|uniref:helix-turn-helix domain-containing protein n=1 Tax=Lentzea sp. NBC_00516 TaxID=2903582 RepID=UPI002E805FC8|nr:helix-turn-helix transcriptional regulator [Lentzea sp. NBC_00516]WUD21292.1 helix-turn-helix domain-containing protein [Lentzea sp. NBC_00516]
MPKDFKSNLQNRAVARALALWRKESGLSLAEVTKRVHWSSAKTSMLQNGLVPITDADVMALALVYEIDDVRRGPVFWGAQRARDPRMFDLATGGTASCVQWTYSEVEAEANYVRTVALDVLPPLAWTREYSAAIRGVQVEAISEQGQRFYPDKHREQMMEQLSDGPSLRMDLVLGEAALRRPVGGALVMADQLFQLASFAQLAGVRVFLVPDRVGELAPMASFSVLSFREAQFDDVAHFDCPHGGMWLENEAERRPYVDTFERLMLAALPAAVTTGAIVKAAQHFKDTAHRPAVAKDS